jgi:hypothetical protein
VVGGAAAAGLVAALVLTVLDEPPPASPPLRSQEPSADSEAADRAPEDGETAGPPREVETVRQSVEESAAPLAERFDSPDPDVRHATAYALLEQAGDALAQVSALRPKRPEAQDLRRRLTAALERWARVVESERHRRNSEEARLYAKLDVYRQVLPPEWIRTERRAYWDAKVAGDAARAQSGRARPAGETAFARIALGRVRYELQELSFEEWRAVRNESEGPARAWVAALRADPRIAAGEAQRRRVHLEQLLR